MGFAPEAPAGAIIPDVKMLEASLLSLVVETSTNLPPDIRRAMMRARESEVPESRSAKALDIINLNIEMASSCQGPICQDTGWPTFLIRTPVGADQMRIERAVRSALVEA